MQGNHGGGMHGGDLYALLGVSRDASTADIRWAYERAINRAHRDGAIKHAEEISRAYDVLSDPRRRQLYDRHGMTALRERSPGAAPPPSPWRHAQHTFVSGVGRPRRRWRMPALAIFALGIVAGLLIAVGPWRSHAGTSSPTTVVVTRARQVLCQSTAGSPGYIYTAQPGDPVVCRNGAQPRVLGP